MEIPTDIVQSWMWLSKEVTSSTWLQTLVAGTLGAAAGSLGTQWAISANERTRSAQAELRAINRAINVCFSITNHYSGFKKQLTRPMVDRYESARAAVAAAQETKGAVVHVQFDLVTLPAASMPIEHLEKLMLDHISIGGRGLVAAMQLRGAHSSLREALDQRQRIISAVQSAKLPTVSLVRLYFGFPDPEGNVDDRFRNNVMAIKSYTDDCIFFSNLIGKELHTHGRQLIKKHGRKVGTAKRNLSSFDWDDRADGLMPDEAEYESWLKGFTKARPWWKFWRPSASAPKKLSATAEATTS